MPEVVAIQREREREREREGGAGVVGKKKKKKSAFTKSWMIRNFMLGWRLPVRISVPIFARLIFPTQE